MTGKDLLSQVARLADMPLAAPPMSDDESDCDSGSSSDGSEYNIHGARAPSAGALASRSSRSPSTGPSATFRKSSIAAAAHRSAAAAAARESPSTSVPTATSGPPAGLLLRKGSVNVSAAALRSCQTQRRKASVAPSKPKPRPAVGRRFSVEVGSFKSASAAQQQRQPTHQGGRKSSWLPQRSSSGVMGGGARRSSQSSISRHGVEQSAKPPATETSRPRAQTSSQISPKSAKKLQTDEQYFAKPRRRYTALPVAQQQKDLMGLLKEYYNPADAATHSVEDNEHYSNKNILMRESLRFDPDILYELNRIWEAAEEDHDGSIQLDEYQQLFFNLHLHLRGEIGTREEAEELAELAATEFHRDAQGKPDLHKEQFRQAIFQLTDLWTDTVSQVRCRLYCITAIIL
jgi:hypothetical protein